MVYQSSFIHTSWWNICKLNDSSDFGLLISYTGVEGLTVGYGVGEDNELLQGSEADQTTMKASYAYGPVTVGFQNLR